MDIFAFAITPKNVLCIYMYIVDVRVHSILLEFSGGTCLNSTLTVIVHLNTCTNLISMVHVYVHLYDMCEGIQRHRHRVHIPCTTVKT